MSPPFVAWSEMTLAESIAEPPPTGTTTVSRGPNPSSATLPRSIDVVPGFGSTPSNSPTSKPAVSRTARTRSTTPERRTPSSVTMNARAGPPGPAAGSAAAIIPGSWSSAPTPNRTSSRRWSSIDRSASDPIS